MFLAYVFRVFNCSAFHFVVKHLCGDDFGIFGKFVAIGEQESDIHVEGSRLIGALVADIYDGDGVFRDVGENVDCGRSVADVQHIKRAPLDFIVHRCRSVRKNCRQCSDVVCLEPVQP